MFYDRFSLIGKKVLITGGAQGIGKAFAYALAEAGAHVMIADVNSKTLNLTCAEFQEKDLLVEAFCIDVKNKLAINNMLESILANHSSLDIVVNNVGVGANSAAEDTSEEEWNFIIDTNLSALFFVAQAVGRIMLKQGYGNLINTASMSSVTIPFPQKQAAYNCSKAAVVQLTKSLASEWADRGVRVNCISPGIVETDLINTEQLRPFKEKWLAQNPMGRLATVEDLKGAIVFMASDASAYMNGHNLIIDGGHSLR